jgi:IclR family pca regulon transcriptional regulator
MEDRGVTTLPENGDAARPRDFVQSLERGLMIIDAFSARRPSMTVTELAESTGLTRAATRRFLLTLVELGYVSSDGHRYTLTPRVLGLGYSYLSALTFPEVATPELEQLVAVAEESSEGAILDGEDIVYVVRVAGPAVMTATVHVGARMPAFATALGRVLLAGLSDPEIDRFLQSAELRPFLPRTITDPEKLRAELASVQKQGWAMVNQELEVGLVALAVPIRDRIGRVVAAINLSTHIGRKSPKRMMELLQPLQLAAARIEVGVTAASASPARPPSPLK